MSAFAETSESAEMENQTGNTQEREENEEDDEETATKQRMMSNGIGAILSMFGNSQNNAPKVSAPKDESSREENAPDRNDDESSQEENAPDKNDDEAASTTQKKIEDGDLSETNHCKNYSKKSEDDKQGTEEEESNDWLEEKTKDLAEHYGPYIKVAYTCQNVVGYLCEVCLAEMTGFQSLELHITGSKHLKKVAIFEKNKGVIGPRLDSGIGTLNASESADRDLGKKDKNRDKGRESGRQSRDKDRYRGNYYHRSRRSSRERERQRNWSRDRDRSKSKSRSMSRDRSRSRDRSWSRDRSRRQHRDRSWSRDRSRQRRDRSRSRDRTRGGWNNDRSRSRDRTRGGWSNDRSRSRERTRGGWSNNRSRSRDRTRGGWSNDRSRSRDRSRDRIRNWSRDRDRHSSGDRDREERYSNRSPDRDYHKGLETSWDTYYGIDKGDQQQRQERYDPPYGRSEDVYPGTTKDLLPILQSYAETWGKHRTGHVSQQPSLETATAYPSLSSSSLKTAVAYSSLSTSSLKTEASYSSMSTNSHRTETAYPGLSTSNLRTETAYPGLSTSNMRTETAYPGLNTSNLRDETAYPGLSTSSLRTETAYPSQSTSSHRAKTVFPNRNSSTLPGSVKSLIMNLASCSMKSKEDVELGLNIIEKFMAPLKMYSCKLEEFKAADLIAATEVNLKSLKEHITQESRMPKQTMTDFLAKGSSNSQLSRGLDNMNLENFYRNMKR